MQYCLSQGPSFHQTKTLGEMIVRLDGDVSFLTRFLSSLFVSLLSSFLLLTGVMLSLFAIHMTEGFSFLAFSLLMFIFILKINRYSVPFWVKNRDNSAKLYGFIEERLYGNEVIKQLGAVGTMLRSLDKLMKQKLVSERKAFMASTLTWSSTAAIFAISSAVALSLGVFFYTKGAMSIGTVFLVFTYAQMLCTPIEQLSNQFQDIQKASASIQRINEMYETKDETPVKWGNKLLAANQSISITRRKNIKHQQH